jgi:hypothetical protein
MVTDVMLVTALVVTMKLALVPPPDTTTLAGTLATTVLLLDNETNAPPPGAGPFNTTVPCDIFPPTTPMGFNVSELTPGGVTVSPAVCVAPPELAEMVT